MVSHAHRFQIALHDTDAAGVVFFAHLFRHAHDAYEGLMSAIGWPLAAMIADALLALPLVHAQADYRRPMRHGDALLCTVTVGAISRGSFTLDYAFTDADGRTSATARTVHAALSPASGQRTALPDALADALTDRTGASFEERVSRKTTEMPQGVGLDGTAGFEPAGYPGF